MKTIYKYPLSIVDRQYIDVNMGSICLDIQVQGDDPVLWFFVDTERPLLELEIIIYGTGHKLDIVTGTYIGTFQLGSFVGHVFMNGDTRVWVEPTLP